MMDLALIGLARFLVGGHAQWVGTTPERRQRIYFANHASHLDTLLIWGALPRRLRAATHPVAAADYWGAGPVRRHIALHGLNAVLVDRAPGGAQEGSPRNALAAVREALARGASLVIFPEGTRGQDRLPGPFKSGLWRLAREFPGAEPVPAYLDNPARAFPKGAWLPVPISCTVRFGAPVQLGPGEGKAVFLERAHAAVCALAPEPPA
jgi:1-acyl-sn-glycerol-3-phosphate acyltransferase